MKSVRELAEKGKDIAEQVRRSLVEMFAANAKFWKPKSFKHRDSVDPNEGDMVQISYSGEVGIVTGVKPQILSVRTRDRESDIHKENLRVIVSKSLTLEGSRAIMNGKTEKNCFLSVSLTEEV